MKIKLHVNIEKVSVILLKYKREFDDEKNILTINFTKRSTV